MSGIDTQPGMIYVASGTSSYADEVMADGPIAYWKLGEGSGTTVVDETGNYNGGYGNSPVLSGAGPIAGTTSMAFGAAGAADGYADCGTPVFDYQSTSATFSIELWVYRNTDGCTYINFGTEYAYPGSGFRILDLETQGIGLRALFTDGYGGSATRSQTGSLASNTWYHVVITIDKINNIGVVYLNGVPVSTNYTGYASAFLTANTPFLIGYVSNTTGQIAHVAIYDYVLSASRVAAHYAAA